MTIQGGSAPGPGRRGHTTQVESRKRYSIVWPLIQGIFSIMDRPPSQGMQTLSSSLIVYNGGLGDANML